MKKETWKFILQTIASILTAIATTLGVTSCMGYLKNPPQPLQVAGDICFRHLKKQGKTNKNI